MANKENDKRKINLVLFIVLLIVFFPAAIIYVIAVKCQPKTPTKYTKNGYISRFICTSFWLINSVVMLFFVTLYGIAFLGASLILLVITLLSKRMKLFSLIYLICCVAIFVVCIITGFFAYFAGGMLGCIFGVVGAIRGIRYVKQKA